MPSTKMERYCANIAQSHVTEVRFRYNNTPPKSIEQFKNENSKCKEQRHHVNTQQHLLLSSSASLNQASQSIKPNPPHQPTQQDNHHYILYLMPGPPAKRKSPPKDDKRKPAAKKTKSAKGKDTRGKDTQTKGPKPHQNRRSDDGNRGNEVHPPPIVSPIGKENIRGEFSEDQGGDVGTNQGRGHDQRDQGGNVGGNQGQGGGDVRGDKDKGSEGGIGRLYSDGSDRPKSHNAIAFQSSLTRAMWLMFQGIWKQRNTFLHDTITGSKVKQMDERLRKLYFTPSDYVSDDDLFLFQTYDLNESIELSPFAKEKWLEMLYLAVSLITTPYLVLTPRP